MALKFNTLKFNTLFKDAKFKANREQMDYLANMQKKYGTVLESFGKRGLVAPEPEKKTSTLTKILRLLGTNDRLLSTLTSMIHSSIKGEANKNDWMGAIAGAYNVGEFPLLNEATKKRIKLLPGYEKYKDYDWYNYYADQVGIGKEFEGYKNVHEKSRDFFTNMYDKLPFLKSKWSYLIPYNPKMSDLLENVFYNFTKSPAALASLVTSIVADPLTYVSFGVGKGATMPLKLGSGTAKSLAKKVGREAIEETAEVALNPRGLKTLGELVEQNSRLARFTPTGQRILKEAGEEALGKAVRGTKKLTTVSKLGEKVPLNEWEKIVMSEASKSAYNKAIFKTAQKQLGESLLEPKLYKTFVDRGGIKVFGKTVIPGSTFEKMGFGKLAKIVSKYTNPIKKTLKEIFTAKGTAPEDLYDIFRYQMDFIPNFEKRNLEDSLLDFFNKSKLTKDQRVKITEYLSMPDRVYGNTPNVIMKSSVKDDVINSILERIDISEVDKVRIKNLTNELNRVRSILSKEYNAFKNVNKGTKISLSKWLKQATPEQQELAERLVKVDQIRTIGLSKMIKDPIADITTLNSYIDNIVDEIYTKSASTIKSTKTTKTIKNTLNETLIKEYGTVKNPIDASYITREGKLIRGIDDVGNRLDHLELTKKVYGKSDMDALEKFAKDTGNIRVTVQDDYIGIEISLSKGMPSEQQLAQIRKLSMNLKGRLNWDLIDSEGNRIQDILMEGSYQDLIDTIKNTLKKFKPQIKQVSEKSIKLKKSYIQSEVDKYINTLNNLKRRPKLNDSELMAAGKARSFFKDLLEKEKAYGIKVKTYRDYLPSIRPYDVNKPLPPFVKPSVTGPSVPTFTKAKKFSSPLKALEAGVPSEMDIGIIMYRRGAKSINAVARKKFFREAREYGKKIISQAESFNYTKLPIDEIKDLYFPNEYAKFFTRAKSYLSDEGTKAFLGYVDKVQGWLRSLLTVIWPGFHMRNAQSNFWQGWLMAGPKYGNPKWHTIAIDILSGNNGSIKMGNRIMSYDEIRDLAITTGAISRGWIGLDNPSQIARELEFGLATKTQKVARRTQLLSKEGLPQVLGSRVGRAVENEARLAAFLINLSDSGGNANFASRLVRKFFFDYGELSQTEKGFRRGILFYTWLRKNIPLQIENLLKQPGKYAQIEKVRKYVTNLAEVPEDFETNKPQYMEELAAIPLPFKDSYGNMLVYNPNFPWQDLGRVNMMDLYSAFTPLIRVPFEMVANREVYFGRDIQEYEGQTKPAPGYLTPLKYLPTNMLSVLGLKVGKDTNTGAEILLMPAKAEYIARQLPFLTSLARSMPQASESDKGQFATLSSLAGLKLMPYEEKKSEYYFTKEEISRLQGIINELKKTGQWEDLTNTKTFKGFNILK